MHILTKVFLILPAFSGGTDKFFFQKTADFGPQDSEHDGSFSKLLMKKNDFSTEFRNESSRQPSFKQRVSFSYRCIF